MLSSTRRQRVTGAPGADHVVTVSTFGDTVKRSFIMATAVALLLALAAASSVLAADPTDDPFVSETPNPSEIAIDPTFVTPEATPTPVSEVLGATGRPQRTPPPTDTVGAPSQSPGAGLQALLLLGVAGITLVLMVGRLPVARRS